MYEMPGVSEDKRTARVAVKKGFASELVGVDGQWEGGLRPFPGFLKAYQLPRPDGPEHDGSSRLLDVWPVSFKIGSGDYGYGFVYKVQESTILHPSNPNVDVVIYFWNSISQLWVKITLINLGALYGNADTDVTVDGRFVVVSIRGHRAIFFYFDTDGATSHTITSPGPGPRPPLISPESAGALGSITTIGTAPASGQVVLVDAPPTGVGLGLGAPGPDRCGMGLDDGQTDADARGLDPGDYAFAYMLFDSNSGRRSALSEIAHARTKDFDPDPGMPSDPSTWPQLFAAIEICYDSTKFDQAYIYRSVRVEDAGGTYIASILHLDQIIDLCEYETNNNPLGGGLVQSVYYYELEDKPLTFQDVWLDRATADEKVPPASSCIAYKGTLVLGGLSREDDEGEIVSSSKENRSGDLQRGLGELRWSSLNEASPEIFPPYNRYVPEKASSEVLAFRQCGDNVIGFSSDRQFHLRKTGGYLVPEEMHEGFGVVGRSALDTVGSMIYFVTSKGLKSVDSQGQLEDIRSLNHLILEEWNAIDLDTLSCAYDPWLSAFFIHNPVDQHTAVLWFNTAIVTEIHDTPFLKIARGVWPIFSDDGSTPFDGRLTERAFFFQDAPRESLSDDFGDWTFPIYIVDERRLKTATIAGVSGQPARRLLDFPGDTRFVTMTLFNSGSTSDLAVIIPAGHTLPTAFTGAWLYVMESPDPTFVGLKAQIKKRTLSKITLTNATKANLNGLPVGSKIAISPVYFRWVGYPLGVSVDNPAQTLFSSNYDFFRVKQANSLGCVFTDVTGAPVTDPIDPTAPDEARDPKYRALLYKGAEEDPSFTSYPRDRSGDIISSLVAEDIYRAAFGTNASASASQDARNGVTGSVITPGIEIMCPDVDFHLLGVKVNGFIHASDREKKAPQS